MPLYSSSLAARGEEVARGTMAFRFARPEGFAFKAGQAINLGLIDPPETDAKGDSRTFSVASAPHEDTVQVATRMRDTAFKRVLGALAIGTPVKLRGPMGNFVLPDDAAQPVVLLAGGIGITPFMSMLRHEDHTSSKRPRVLFYANRSERDAPFLFELNQLARPGTGLRMVSKITESAPAPGAWGGIADPEFLARELRGVESPIFFLAGPPGMVGALRKALGAMGAPADAIRTDEFYGY
ncbi:MAG TPA: FAD-dependent oxidoreductase [Usitatibacter sp.]|nr:FAD-dependent oxidoreductase [Usitatibacter sp.]